MSQRHCQFAIFAPTLYLFAGGLLAFGAWWLVAAAANGPEMPAFTDATKQAGIQWQHFSGESDDRYLVEAMGGGVAFIDFDGDGKQDLFFVTGGETPRGHSSRKPRNALYRNFGNGTFQEVAEEAGVAAIPFYGMGAAAADFDNDGFTDLYVTGYPRGALFRNNGNGTFTDITERAGVENRGKWGSSAAWFDYDQDGRLDLFICNYAKFSFDDRTRCEYEGRNTYCAQTAYEGDIPTLYHNNGDGTFTDVTEKAGLGKLRGRALGVVAIDLNDDGRCDLAVARDASPNLLLINRGDGTFEDKAIDAELAYSADGNARAGMGIDAADVDGNGSPDLAITNFNDESHTLFENPWHYPYNDWTMRSGLLALTRLYVGWGARFLDYDNDGWPDLLIVNGHINQIVERTRTNVSYKEPPLLLKNNKGNFRDMRESAGSAFHGAYLGRGLAAGDYDNDGGVDAVLTTLNGPPVLLHNNAGALNQWLGVELRGKHSNRDAIGAKLTLRQGVHSLVRWITGGSSYLSSHDKRVVFGLGKHLASDAVTLEIRWPNGNRQQVSDLRTGRYTRIEEAGW